MSNQLTTEFVLSTFNEQVIQRGIPTDEEVGGHLDKKYGDNKWWESFRDELITKGSSKDDAEFLLRINIDETELEKAGLHPAYSELLEGLCFYVGFELNDQL